MTKKKHPVSVIRVTEEEMDTITANIRRVTGNSAFEPTTDPPDYVKEALETLEEGDE